MRWGKVIDHDRCIGCHACSVACKQENGVPLGSFRTWVKYVEKGTFPEVRRHFAVLRCNQCENPPCVAICPTSAMYRRPDGIVDFDSEQCIGCKGCIQACPYDAIYIDPDSQTAAKCHFCAHRVEKGLEPACVTACPERALLVGDLDDATSVVSQIVARAAVRVRKPELGTRPKVFYKGVDEVCLTPDAARRPSETMWGDGRSLPLYEQPPERRVPVAPGAAGGTSAQALVAYDVPREETPWGWKISAYMLAKGIGAGSLIVGGTFALLTGALPAVPAILAVLFLAITSALLVWDLKRPERFLKILFRPQWRSWLVRGTYCILAAVLVALTWLALGFERGGPSRGEASIVGALAILTGIGAAGYTAFLLGQARGRAFWQSTLLLPHLVIQAFAAGTATLIVLDFQVKEGWLAAFLLGAIVMDTLAILSELYSHVGTEDARQAARVLTQGRLKDALLMGVWGPRFLALLALVAYFAISVLAPPARTYGPQQTNLYLPAVAAAFTLVGLGAWDHLYIVAGQDPPLS
jgi:Fe-S-cluster-containing dehydrogenase component/formate-dependent nitrite reductase membrane component NrfD